jgi:hypothetical protein
MKKVLILTVEDATQAKLILKPDFAVIKIPGNIPRETQTEVRDKLMKVADAQCENKEFLKAYYKIGTPYIFLNRKVSGNKKETCVTYKYEEL